MSAAPRAERLRDHFVGWQCRIRADAMRRREGRPTLGMRPQALSAAGEELAPAVTTLLVRKEAGAFAPEFRHLARRTHDPRAMREAALALLAERYYQYARDFSGLLTATFAAESPLAATLAHEGRCVLSFAQDGQRYALPCAVALSTTKGRFFSRSCRVHPMKVSRGASFHAAVEKPSMASGQPFRSWTA